MTAAPTFTALPPQRPVRRPPPPVPEPPTRPLLPHDSSRAAVGGVRGKPNKFSNIDPLLWQVGLVVFIVAAGVALTVYLLLRWLPPAVVTEAGLWSIAAGAGRLFTGLFG